MTVFSFRVLGVSAAIALVVGCVSLSQQSPAAVAARTDDSPLGWRGVVYVTERSEVAPGNSASRLVFVATFRVTNAGVEPKETIILRGARSSLPAGRSDYIAQLVSRSGEVLMRREYPDPRRLIVEGQGETLSQEGVLAVRVPFDVEAASLRIIDSTGATAAEVKLAPIVEKFCAEDPQDDSCARRPPYGSAPSGRSG